MKRLFVFIIVLSITFNWLPSNVFASVVPGEEAASSEYVEQKIEELFAERATLAHDYDSNAAEISKIDAELTNLGVETLTDDEFCALMKDVVGTQATLLTDVDSYGVKWTSYRATVIRGANTYEVQVITGVPARSGSGLEEVYSTISKSSSGTLDALTNALKVVGVAQLSSISNVAGNIVTILDIIKAGIDGASATETVTGFKCQYTTDVVVNIKYAFVKKMGQADSTQVLGYRGNYVDYTVNMTVPGSITVDGVVYSNIDNYKSNGVVKSAHYSNVVNKVADWAATSEANGTAIVNLYLLSKLKLSFFNGTSISLDLPNVLPPL